jgi:MFS family permease
VTKDTPDDAVQQQWDSRTWLALAATMSGQALGAAAQLSPAVLATFIATDTGINASLIGFYTGTVFLASAIATLGGSGLIMRHGGVRAVQIGAVLTAVGISLAAIGHPIAFIASALVIGAGYGPMTPASSIVLSRWAPANRLGLVMSIKQTGVPIGYALAGISLPILNEIYGWQTTIIIVAIVCAIAAFLIGFAISKLDVDRSPEARIGFAGARLALGMVWTVRRLRRIACASLAFAGVQVTVTSFLVVYLETQHGYPNSQAGHVLAIANLTAIAGRILWGGAADYVRTSVLLMLLPITMAAAMIGLIMVDSSWDLLAVFAVAISLGSTVIAWNGLMLTEVARQAPPGQVGMATSGVLALTFLGSMAFPQALSAALSANGSYEVGFGAMICVSLAMAAWYLPDALTKK